MIAPGRSSSAVRLRMAEKNHLGDKKVTMLPGVIPSLSNDAEFFPGLSKSWALTFMVNDEEAPTGRPAGALGWAGLANLFYWIDRRNGFGEAGVSMSFDAEPQRPTLNCHQYCHLTGR